MLQYFERRTPRIWFLDIEDLQCMVTLFKSYEDEDIIWVEITQYQTTDKIYHKLLCYTSVTSRPVLKISALRNALVLAEEEINRNRRRYRLKQQYYFSIGVNESPYLFTDNAVSVQSTALNTNNDTQKTANLYNRSISLADINHWRPT